MSTSRTSPSVPSMRISATVRLAALLLSLAAAAPPLGAQDLARIADFDIDAQPLAAALLAFSEQAGVQIVMDPRQLEGKRAPAVKGPRLAARALSELLADSGLAYELVSDSTVLVRPKARPDGGAAQAPIPLARASDSPEPPAIASAGEAERPEAIEEIVVTVQKRAQVLHDVPLSVQAFTGADLERAGIRDLAEIINFIPGASQGRTTTAGNPSYQIRGVSAYYGESTVGYYLDEAAFVIPNRNFAPVARTFDVERVEVLRGPQGTLYGLGAMGGTIRFITADPDLREMRVRGGAGVSDTAGGDLNYFGDLAVSVPLVRERLAVRATASHERLGGFAESPTLPGDKDTDVIRNYRVKALAKPAGALTLKAMYQRNDVRDDWGKQYASADPAAFPPSLLNGVPVPGRNDAVYDMATGYASLDAGPILVESATGYIDREADGTLPLDLGMPFVPILTTGGGSDTLVSELRLVSQHGGPWEWVLGGIYQDSANLESVHLAGAPSPPFPNPVIRDETTTWESESFAVFGEISYGFLDGRLRPLVGLRWFTDDRRFETTSRIPFPTTFRTSDTFESWNPRFNLSFEASDNALLYLNVAKGFRSGTFNSLSAVTDATVPASLSVDPDTLWSYEIGAKLALFDNRLLVEGAVYYFKWTDQQINFSTPRRFQVVVNAGDTVGLGFDYALRWITPLAGLTLQAAGNINETEFDHVDNAAQLIGTAVIENRQVASVPRHNHTISAGYTRPLPGVPWDLGFYGTYTFIDEQGDPTVTVLGERQHLLRLRAGVSADRWSAHVVANNVLDSDEPFQISASGVQRYYPRTVGLEFTFEY